MITVLRRVQLVCTFPSEVYLNPMHRALHDVFNSRLKPASFIIPGKRPTFNFGLEGLRGLAAIWVCYAHVVGHENALDPTYHPDKNFFYYLQAAHGAVLIFFILSGYVIGITSTARFSNNNAKKYLFKRLIRLFPIYIIAISISVLVLPVDSPWTITGNLLFLQNLLVPVLSANSPLWTLNYEVFYYLAFILIWKYKPNLLLLCIASSVLGIAGWLVPAFPPIISGYAIGYIFWLLGLVLAWKVPPHKISQKVPLLSCIFLLLATNHLAPGQILLNGLGISNSNIGAVNLADLTLLPICCLLVSSITQRYPLNMRWLLKISFLIPSLAIFPILLAGRMNESVSWSSSATLLIIAYMLLPIKARPDRQLSSLSYMGSVSYAMYVLHTPIMYVILNWFPFSGSLATFWLRLQPSKGVSLISLIIGLKPYSARLLAVFPLRKEGIECTKSRKG